ncbi:RanGTP-binding protein-domain-containing protein [Phyllosticta citribraziliensis]|uniref:RanGTP-binding protein-domain-containing protein n=1 Tax=Phyllosticta citribraziliensis TaxID=989973 RepID=A0ABR1LJ77_9PEZI
MDILLSKVTQQAMNYAIRSGIVITSSFAMKQCSRLLKTVGNIEERQELATLQRRLEAKIRIISPAIDMIELISARGNTSLESAVNLTKSLRWGIQALGQRLAKAAGEEELQRRGSSRAQSKAHNEMELKLIISDIRKLLESIEDAVPLINLAITTSGANLSTSLPATVSPSRLLQASTFLTAGDSQYSALSSNAVQIGPAFTLSMYMLFSGHIRPHDEEGIRETTWKEVIHKARVKLMRVPLDRLYDFPSSPEQSGKATRPHGSIRAAEGRAFEFAYQLILIEDLDDDRVHTFEEDEPQPGPFEDVPQAGIREVMPIHEISKIFYADTGKILNIGTDGETNNPILLLKRDIHAVPPRRMMERQASESAWFEDAEPDGKDEPPSVSEEDEQSAIDAQLFRESRAPESEPPQESSAPPLEHWRLPPDLDLEWMAFEVYSEEPDSDDEDLDETELPPSSTSTDPNRSSSLDPRLTAGMSNLDLRTPSPSPARPTQSSPPPTAMTKRRPTASPYPQPASSTAAPGLPPIKTSLSLLEMLIRLTALQQFQQNSHLSIPDELLTFFLSESSTVGAGNDSDLRKRVRRDAARRVGFDPYDESPIKRRGEEYLVEHAGGADYDASSPGRMYSRQTTPYGAEIASDPPYPYTSSAATTRPSPSPRRPVAGSSASVSSSASLPHRDVPLPSRERDLGQGASPSPLLRKATRPVAGVHGDQARRQGIRHGRVPETPPESGSV